MNLKEKRELKIALRKVEEIKKKVKLLKKK